MCLELSAICKCMSKIRFFLLLQIGGPKTTYFSQFLYLMTTLMAYIFPTKHNIHNRTSALKTTRDLLHRLKMSRTLVHKWLKLDVKFYPLRKLCILLHRHASQMDISKWNSTKLWQMVDSKVC